MVFKPHDAHWKCGNCGEEGAAYSDEGQQMFPCPNCKKMVTIEPNIMGGPEPRGPEKKY